MAERLRLRCIWPDRWLETRLEVPKAAVLGQVKRQALEALLKTESVDPTAYYVELDQRTVRDESVTLDELQLSDGAVLTIRAHDLHHPPPYRG
jgi:hypothetical protein